MSVELEIKKKNNIWRAMVLHGSTIAYSNVDEK